MVRNVGRQADCLLRAQANEVVAGVERRRQATHFLIQLLPPCLQSISPSMASSSETLHSAASFQKLPGTLTLAADALAWTPSSSSSASASQLRLPLESISGLSMSKAGSATVALQVAFDEVGVKATGIAKAKALFTFTGGIQGDQKKAEEQREAFKEKLVVVIADNRARKGNDGASGSASPAPAPTAAGSSSAATPAVGSPRASVAPPAAAAPARGKTAAPSAASSGGPTELELRISLLKSNPSLAALHRQTVMANIIPDAEFWSHPTRQTMLRAARQAARQQKGRNARIVDPRFTVGKNGELKLEITDEDRKDLLQQNDVLRLAWSENVPEKVRLRARPFSLKGCMLTSIPSAARRWTRPPSGSATSPPPSTTSCAPQVALPPSSTIPARQPEAPRRRLPPSSQPASSQMKSSTATYPSYKHATPIRLSHLKMVAAARLRAIVSSTLVQLRATMRQRAMPKIGRCAAA